MKHLSAIMAVRQVLAVILLFAAAMFSVQAQTTARATATVASGMVVSYTVLDGGSGYQEPPVVTVVGGGGNGASAVAVLTGGSVSAIYPVTTGSGYTSVPQVVISAPPVESALLAVEVIARLTIKGLPGDTNQIETANSLGTGAVWVPLTSIVLTNSVQQWIDTISPPMSWRFYRAVLIGSGSRPNPGARFVWLPPGTFRMGSPTNEVGRKADEGPQTAVALTRGFYIGRYEVTQGEYQALMGSNPSYFKGNTNYPVETVAWDNATNYCALLTARERTAGRLGTGWAYRLPTEAEWQYACRAGSTNRFSYGDDPGYTQLGNYVWYQGNCGFVTQVVGTKPANRWGLYDMEGNVWELCSDRYGAYPGGSVTDPQGAASGSRRVVAGGCWGAIGDGCRSATRASYLQTDKEFFTGFRVVLAPVP